MIELLIAGSFFFASESVEMSFFPSILVPYPFSLCTESTSYVFSFRMVFFSTL